jgi:tetratricopeptide (TPR) repeat protein
MRGLSVAAVLAVWLLPALPAQAGLYNTEERLLNYVFSPPGEYRRFLRDLQQIVAIEFTNSKDSPRHQVLQHVAALEKMAEEGRLSSQDRVNLAAFYIRLNDPAKAIALLEAVPPRQRDWMAWSNLATASQLAGNLERAEAYLSEALENWPKTTNETTSWRLNFLRVAEQYYLRLLRSRLREQRTGGGPPGNIDEIFPGLKLVGPSGEYEAGLLAAEQWARLPAYHMEIVQVLTLWMPHDSRLRWLLAELLNANGSPGLALEIMEELSLPPRNFRNAEFAAHHLTLRHAKEISERLSKLRKMFLEEKVSTGLPTLAGLMPPGPNAALDASSTAIALQTIAQAPLPKEEPSFAEIAGSPASTEPASAAWTPEWRQISVSFVAGVIVALLLSMQLREMRKRKHDAAPAAKE